MRLTRQQIQNQLLTISNWQYLAKQIQRTFKFKGFPEAIKFVNQVAKLAEKRNHHPSIDIRYNQVTLTLFTHSEGGVTKKDIDLAKALNAL